MASKRDLVEAHAYNRRRLVTAFTSGAPGGRELEPPRPWRALVAGAVLAGLVVAAAALVDVLRPGLPPDWDENRLIIAEDSGSRYVTTGDGELRPVLNIASARLVLPGQDGGIVTLPDSELADLPRGSAVGIPGAPDSLPSPDRLVQSGWTSCIGQRGEPELRISRRPAASSVGAAEAITVTLDGAVWVVWDGLRFPVQPDAVDEVLLALRLDGTPTRAVPPSWLNLFPPGPELRGVTVPGAGEPPPPGSALPATATVGSVVEVVAADGSIARYVLVPDGRVLLTDVALGLYSISNPAEPIPVTQDQLRGLTTLADAPYPAQWPADLPGPWPDDAVCALLAAGPGDVPTVSLARLVGSEVEPSPEGGVVVEPGAGAVVRAVNGSVVNRGTPYLVDGIGQRYALAAGAREQLGFGDVDPVPVPLAWTEPLTDGPQLSSGAARQAPGGT